MTSISTSDEILRIENLSLVFHTDIYRPWTWRDLVTGTSRGLVAQMQSKEDRLPLFRGLNIRIRKGDRVGLLGVNGTGKTSLCRCIAGMYRPTSGSIRVHGRVRAIFDTSVAILPELTGRENARLLMEFLYPEALSSHVEMLEDALAFSELGRFLDVPYRLYSNGMQARLCLSLVSCRPCDLLILDEVFDGADVFFREKIATRILKMIEGSHAAIFVSHSYEQLRRVCNRLIVFGSGAVAHDGAVDEGIRRYQELQKGGSA